jgi:tripartite-type tricarboxylate transporter receptor subunit TctC
MPSAGKRSAHAVDCVAFSRVTKVHVMKLPRRRFLQLAAGAAALSAVSRIARAQTTYPTRPITMIVPAAAGGGTDVTARIVAEHMTRTLGQQVIIENIAGAGGTIGSTRAMRANPDGYTIEMGLMGSHAAAVAFYPSLAYKPDVDFEPIGMVSAFSTLIVARKDFPPKDLKEFVLFVKANANKLNVAHAGVGSVFFTTCLLLNSLLDVKPTFVPFNGGGPAMNALVGGQVDYMCGDVITSAAQLRVGTIKAYAIGTSERNPVLPNVPTSKEAGLPEFQADAWNALFVPKATPKPVLDKLTETLDKALDDENTRKRLLEFGSSIPDKAERGQQALALLVKSEIARLTPIIKAANIKAQ